MASAENLFECMVCCEEFDSDLGKGGHFPIVRPCGHHSCFTCAQKMKNQPCPNCREEFSMEGAAIETFYFIEYLTANDLFKREAGGDQPKTCLECQKQFPSNRLHFYKMVESVGICSRCLITENMDISSFRLSRENQEESQLSTPFPPFCNAPWDPTKCRKCSSSFILEKHGPVSLRCGHLLCMECLCAARRLEASVRYTRGVHRHPGYRRQCCGLCQTPLDCDGVIRQPCINPDPKLFLLHRDLVELYLSRKAEHKESTEPTQEEEEPNLNFNCDKCRVPVDLMTSLLCNSCEAVALCADCAFHDHYAKNHAVNLFSEEYQRLKQIKEKGRPFRDCVDNLIANVSALFSEPKKHKIELRCQFLCGVNLKELQNDMEKIEWMEFCNEEAQVINELKQKLQQKLERFDKLIRIHQRLSEEYMRNMSIVEVLVSSGAMDNIPLDAKDGPLFESGIFQKS